MEKLVFAIYDMQADVYDRPMVFDDENLAIAGIRRDIRDMYLRKEITLDALRDRQLCSIGTYDTSTGCFGDSGIVDIRIRMSDFVGDLVVSDEI